MIFVVVVVVIFVVVGLVVVVVSFRYGILGAGIVLVRTEGGESGATR